jgi:hypothetical protein
LNYFGYFNRSSIANKILLAGISKASAIPNIGKFFAAFQHADIGRSYANPFAQFILSQIFFVTQFSEDRPKGQGFFWGHKALDNRLSLA